MKHTLKLLLLALAILAILSAGPVTSIQARALAFPVSPVCTYSPVTANVIEQTTAETYGSWISKLSGAEPVTVGGQPYTITTRYSPALFDGNSKAFDYLKEQVQALYPGQVEEQSYPAQGSWAGQTWKNLVVTIPGKVHPDQVVIMSAHFDSTSGPIIGPPYRLSPGADDNATGSASLLEAARLLRDLPLDRTVKLIWFTGEEQGLWGSSAYTNTNDLIGVVGVVNLDMFGYDGDNDNCFEMHVSQYSSQDAAPRSNAVGQCMVSAIKNYGLGLKYDYLTTNGTTSSDHANFWRKGVGAIEVGENFYTYNNTPGGCANTLSDENPNYHKTSDTLANMNLPFALSIHKAALAAVIDLASDSPLSFYFPLLTNNP